MSRKSPLQSVQYTRHAERRMSQRGLSDDFVNIALKYGRREYLGSGEIICFFGQRNYRNAVRNNPSAKQRLLSSIGVTLVVSTRDHRLITAYRAKRPKRSRR